MDLWVSIDAVRQRIVEKQQTFFAKRIKVDEELGKAILAFEQKWKLYQEWLRKIEEQLQVGGELEVTKEEGPECLEVPNEEPPKEQASAPRSSKKSPSKRKKKASSSSTSQKTDE